MPKVNQEEEVDILLKNLRLIIEKMNFAMKIMNHS